jgi:hypothetical protein
VLLHFTLDTFQASIVGCSQSPQFHDPHVCDHAILGGLVFCFRTKVGQQRQLMSESPVHVVVACKNRCLYHQ